jgi:hypothetical protein
MRVCVERGSMPYSAVIQPCPLPFKKPGTFAAFDQHRTFGVLGVFARQHDVAQLVDGAAAWAGFKCHGEPLL